MHLILKIVIFIYLISFFYCLLKSQLIWMPTFSFSTISCFDWKSCITFSANFFFTIIFLSKCFNCWLHNTTYLFNIFKSFYLLISKLNVKLILFEYYNLIKFFHLPIIFLQKLIFINQVEFLLYLKFLLWHFLLNLMTLHQA